MLMLVIVIILGPWLAGWRLARIPATIMLGIMFIAGWRHRGATEPLGMWIDVAGCVILAWLVGALPQYVRALRVSRSMRRRPRLDDSIIFESTRRAPWSRSFQELGVPPCWLRQQARRP